MIRRGPLGEQSIHPRPHSRPHARINTHKTQRAHAERTLPRTHLPLFLWRKTTRRGSSGRAIRPFTPAPLHTPPRNTRLSSQDISRDWFAEETRRGSFARAIQPAAPIIPHTHASTQLPWNYAPRPRTHLRPWLLRRKTRRGSFKRAIPPFTPPPSHTSFLHTGPLPDPECTTHLSRENVARHCFCRREFEEGPLRERAVAGHVVA
jgi:hypothetical protein